MTRVRFAPQPSALPGRRLAVAVVTALAATLPGGIAAHAVPMPAAASTTAPGTIVLEWNKHAVDALTNAPTAPTPGAAQPPNVSILHLAMVHGAVYDAVNSITGGHEPYLDGVPDAPASASAPAAVATAAYQVLVGMELVPALPAGTVSWLSGARDASLAAIPEGPDKAAGIAAGEAAAAAMLAARADDGRFGPYRHTPGSAPGVWRPTPPGFVNDPNAWVAFVDPFVLKSSDQFRTRGPLKLTSRGYAREYEEVQTLGAVNSVRTPAQDAVARFYTVNAVELFERTFRTIATGLDTAQQARLFAQLNLTGADAIIQCWNEKAHWLNWRPITAIQQGDQDGNPRTAADPAWTPLLPTPPYPDHASGYNCISAAAMYAGKAFFGTDRWSFDLVRVATGEPDVVRHYDRFSDVVDDTIDARVWQGVHFRTADEAGAKIGRDVARWVDRHCLEPVR